MSQLVHVRTDRPLKIVWVDGDGVICREDVVRYEPSDVMIEQLRLAARLLRGHKKPVTAQDCEDIAVLLEQIKKKGPASP